jgi:long-chain acyl-CoA synthetase
MNSALWLERTAQVMGDRPALLLGDSPVADYAQFARRAAGLAGSLQRGGVGPGDRIGIFAKNVPDYLTCFYAIWRAGAVAVPVNAKLHPKEAAWILANAEATSCFVTDALGEGLADACDLPMTSIGSEDFETACAGAPIDMVSRDRDDLAWLFYTSGHDGKAKGVCITHGMLAATSLCYPVDVDPVGPEDAALYAAPMSHGAGIYAPIHVRMGAAHVVPKSGGFEAEEVLDLSEAMGRRRCSWPPPWSVGSPTRRRRPTAGARGSRPSSMAAGRCTAPISRRRWTGSGRNSCRSTGRANARWRSPRSAAEEVADRTHPRWRERLASVGRAQSQSSRSRSATGRARTLPPGEIGEIMVQGRAGDARLLEERGPKRRRPSSMAG